MWQMSKPWILYINVKAPKYIFCSADIWRNLDPRVECLRYQTSYMHLSLPLINLSCYFYFPIDQKHCFTHISLSWVAWLICFLSSLNLFQENFFLHLHASDKAFDKGNIFVRLTWLVFFCDKYSIWCSTSLPIEKQYGILSTTVPTHLTLTFVDLT